jgi:hypothetical protein
MVKAVDQEGQLRKKCHGEISISVQIESQNSPNITPPNLPLLQGEGNTPACVKRGRGGVLLL